MPKYLQKMIRRSESQQSLLDNNISEFDVEPKTNGCVSSRLKIAILSLLACVVLYITRVNLNVAIVSMVKDEPQNSSDHNSSSIPLKSACPSSKSHLFINQETKVQNGQFDWSQSTQGFILGSFYLGYICFQTIGSRFAEIFGAKWICGYGILLSGIINLLTPFIVEYFYLFIASRILLGLVQSAVFPSFYALFVKWYPDDERAKYLPWLDCGTCIGTIVAMGMSGYIIKSKSLGGWPTVFYVSGLLAVIWFILWYITAHSDPRQSKSISKDELNYIITNTEDFSINTQSVPWIKIFKSKQFQSVLIAKLFLSFTFGLLLTKLPTYLDVINIPIDEVSYQIIK